MSKSRTTLKTYFETGDIPTELHFADLIDSLRHLSDGEVIQDFNVDADGTATITLSDGRQIIISQPEANVDYVPKSGGGFTGKLGIGTTTPTSALEVKGPYDGSTSQVIINTTSSNAELRFSDNGTSKGFVWFSKSSDQMAFGRGNDVNSLFVNAVGNFGIGTNQPGQKLHVDGGQVRIETPTGYADIGSKNDAWFHFETDRNNFWFSKGVHAKGDLRLYNKDTYLRFSDGAIVENGTKLSDKYLGKTAKAADSDKLDGLNSSDFLRVNGKAADSDKLDGLNSSDFIRKSGDTMTGNLLMTNQEVRWFENTDYAAIGFKNISDSDSDSYMYFKTADNGNEYFRWEHYRSQQGNIEWMQLKSGGLKVLGHVTAGNNIYANGSAYFGDSKEIMRFSDSFLRLNPANGFTSGIFCGSSILRTDGQLQVGSNGNKFRVDTAGNIYEKGTLLTNKYLGKTAKAADSDKLDGLNSSDFLRSNANDTFIGMLSVGSTNSRQAGMYGLYDSNKIAHIWSIGTNYKVHNGGANFGNLYGLAYKHINNGTGGTMAGGHQMVWCHNGTPRSAIGDNIWTSGIIYENGTKLSDRYLGKTAKAADSDKLDGLNSSDFLRVNGKAVDSDKLDGLNSSDFIRKSGDTITGNLTVNGSVTSGAGYTINSGHGKGLRFWNNDDYKIYMSATNQSGIGGRVQGETTSDYNMYFKMANGRNRGFVFKSGNNNIAGIDASGNGRFKGSVYENNTKLSDKYLGKTAKANDANKLDGVDSSGFVRKGIDASNAWNGLYLIFSHAATDNVDAISYNDSTNAFYFNADRTKTNTSANAKVYVGELISSGDVTAFSDSRLKQALKPVKESFLDKIDQLKPTYYQWKDKVKEQKEQLGFIAQEVMEVFPEWVRKNEEHYSMSYDKMGAVLAVKGIQELHAEIKSLKAQLKALQHGTTV